MKTSQPRHIRAGTGAGGSRVASGSATVANFSIGEGPTQCSQPSTSTPTIDWQEARRLASQSEAMAKLILAAVNQHESARTNRRGAAAASQVIDLAAIWFGYTTAQLRKPGKPAALAWARQVAMYFCCELTVATSVEIGELLQRHHGCVGAACKVVANRLETEPRTQGDLANLRAHLNSKLK